MTVPEIPGFGELTEIGRGGFSRVYRAREFEFDRLVAIKVLNDPIKDGSTAAVFERECRTMGRLLHHPNIVTVIRSAYTGDDRPCIVMELFHEGSYQHLLRRSGPIALADLLAAGVKIAGALLTAHEAKVLHGDVKPGNIFRSKFAEPALGDFGIASFVRDNAKQSARGFSVHYAPAELIDGAPGPGSDQYSLAATLFTLALGRRPFDSSGADAGDDNEQVLMRMLKAPVPRLPDRFPRAFADALWRAMSKDPDSRFGDLAEFADRLNEAAAASGLPVTALPYDSLRTLPAQAGIDADSVDAYAAGAAVAGVVMLSGGRTEPVDADLVIGRQPAAQPLRVHQRGVVHGQDDRTVSRRQVELRVRGGQVTAVNVGRRAAVITADGATTELAGGDARRLNGGDTLLYGADSWLRFEPTGVVSDAMRRASVSAGPSSEQGRAGAESGGHTAGSTTRDGLLRGSREAGAATHPKAAADGSALAAEIMFSDGRVERLDAALVVGRSPRALPLESHQRAVVQGTGDRTISRRHVEIGLRDGRVIASIVGRGAVVQRADRTVHELGTGDDYELAPGDILHYGNSCWLRCGETAGR